MSLLYRSMSFSIPTAGRAPSAAALLCLLFLPFASRAAAPPGAAPGMTVGNGTGDSSLDWLAPAFEHYLDYAFHFYGAPPVSPFARPGNGLPAPAALVAEYHLEGERVVFSVEFHVKGSHGGSKHFGGPLTEAAIWLVGTGRVLEAALLSGSSPGEGIPPPTLSTEALRRFAASSGAVGMEEKERLLKEALELDPAFHDALFRLAVTAAAGGRYDEAGSLFTRYLEQAPGNVPAIRNAAICLAATGRQAEAADLLRKATEAAPGDRRARYGLAGALRGAGSLAEADRVYREIIEDFPQEGEALFERVLLRAAEGDVPGARAMINEFSPERSREARAFFYLRGQEELGAGRVDSSLTAFSMAGLVDPDDIQTGLALGVVSYQKGDFEGSVRRFQEVLRVRKGDPETYRYLAMAFERLGDQGTALDYYRKATDTAAEGSDSRWAKDLFLGSMSRSREADAILPLLSTPFGTGFSSKWIEGPVKKVEAGKGGPAGPIPPAPAGIPGEGEGKDRLAELERELAGYRARNAALTEQIRQKEEQAVFVAKEALAAQKRHREAQAMIADIEGRLKEKEEAVSSRETELAAQAAEQESSLEEYGRKVADLGEELEGKDRELEALGGRETELAAKVAEQESSLEEYGRKVADLGEELEAKDRELEALRGREAELAEQVAEQESSLEEQGRKATSLGKELETLRGRETSLEGELAEAREGKAALEKDLEGKEKELDVLEVELARLRSISVENEELRRLNTRLATKVRDIAARLVRLSSELGEREQEIGLMK